MSTWLYLTSSAIYLMAGGTNKYLSKRSQAEGKPVAIPPDWWLKREDPPTSLIVQMEGTSPEPYLPPTPQLLKPVAGLEKYTQGKPYLLLTWPGGYDRHGFKAFQLQLISSGKAIDGLTVISGSPATQRRELVDPGQDYSGSGKPISEGIYSIGHTIRLATLEKGIGFVKIPLDVLPDFKVNNRSELLFHDDANRQQARGSLGCVVTYTQQDMERIVSWCIQKEPEVLIVDYRKGLLKQKGVELISLGKPLISQKPGLN